MKEKKLLFSLTKKDFEIQTFCTGGPGGQHKNAKQNGVRIIHTASGARAEHRDGRDQFRNRAEAFKKVMNTDTFKKWHKLEVQKRLGIAISECEAQLRLEAKLDEMMRPENLKVEIL